MIWVKSPSLKIQIIGVFVNKHGLLITSILFRILRICRSPFKCNYAKNKKHFLSFLPHLWNLHQILYIFQKKKIVRGNVFLNIKTVKYLVGPLFKRRRFRPFFHSQLVKWSQTLAKTGKKELYHNFSSLLGELIWKITPLLKFEIIGLFVNILTVVYKYPVQDSETLPFPIQMQLSWKRKIFFQFLCSIDFVYIKF